MRFMILVKANEDSEAGVLPTDEQITEMAAFHEELAAAGALVAADGLQATSKGFRIRYDGRGRRTVIDGPFTEAKELVAGFTMIDVASREEALEWARRFPCPAPPRKGLFPPVPPKPLHARHHQPQRIRWQSFHKPARRCHWTLRDDELFLALDRRS